MNRIAISTIRTLGHIQTDLLQHKALRREAGLRGDHDAIDRIQLTIDALHEELDRLAARQESELNAERAALKRIQASRADNAEMIARLQRQRNTRI